MPSPPVPLGPASTARLGNAGTLTALATLRDVAGAAVWLASDASDDVFDTSHCIDGGTTIYAGFAGNG
jgi:hypothetical protein